MNRNEQDERAFTMDPYARQASLLRAIAHPVRLRILEALSREECCVCHLTTLLRQRQPYVSQQLMTLREAGLVAGRKDGTIVYYSLADQRISRIIAEACQLVGVEDGADYPLAVSPVEGCPCPRCRARSRYAGRCGGALALEGSGL